MQKGLSNFHSISYEVFLCEFLKGCEPACGETDIGGRRSILGQILGHLAKFVPRDKASEEAMSRITRSPMRAIPAHFNSYHVNIKGVPFAVTLKEVILCGAT
jgi:hypothetical protein